MHKIIIPIVILILLAVAIPVVGVATAKPALTPDPVVEEKIVPVFIEFASEVETEIKEELEHPNLIPLDPELQSFIIKECERVNIDPFVVFAIIWKESNFDATVIGDSGKSFGLMQVQKRYHLERMERFDVTDLLNPYQNVKVGIDFLSELFERYGHNTEMVLVAYNMGCAGAYSNCFSKGIYSNEYSKAVISKCQELHTNLSR